MHAQRIIQDLILKQYPAVHAKRRDCLAKVSSAAVHGGLSLIRMSKALDSGSDLRHRIKCCDRLLSNSHLQDERTGLYRAMAARVLARQRQVGIVVDWSDMLPDCSMQLLRAAVMVQGRAIVLYEELHPRAHYASARVHRDFMKNLRLVLPAHCRPVIVTDAGFRAPWFQMLSKLGFDWIGRIRNRDMVRPAITQCWVGCKSCYADTKGRALDLGQFDYVRSNPTPCRLVLYKKRPCGRTVKTVHGKPCVSKKSNSNRKVQHEPWLLALAPSLATMSADQAVKLYAGRMQIEQTFRDLKNPQWGMGMRDSQTRKRHRLAILLLIAALATYALWLIGLTALGQGYRLAYGSAKKSASTLSILSLARHWLTDRNALQFRYCLYNQAENELMDRVKTYEI